MAKNTICSVEDCGKPLEARGFCVSHYKRWKRHGDPLKGRTPDGSLPKFVEMARNYNGYDCLFWPYAQSHGYGFMSVKGKRISISRLMCEEQNGPPQGDRNSASHSCNNGHLGCVTKKHLSWKTHKENMEDKIAAGTVVMGEEHGGSKITESEAAEIKKLCFSGELTVRKIASLYGIARATVTDIKYKRTWKHLP